MQIPSVSSFTPITSIDKTNQTAGTGAANNITKTFNDVLNSLNDSQQNADSLVSQLAAGENVDVHTVMLATEENDVNFRVAMAIRDRLVEAYKEVMRMSI